MLTNETEELKVLLQLESNNITTSYYDDEYGDFYGAVNYLKFFIEDSTNKATDQETIKRLIRKGDIVLLKYKNTLIETTKQGFNRIKRLEALE